MWGDPWPWSGSPTQVQGTWLGHPPIPNPNVNNYPQIVFCPITSFQKRSRANLSQLNSCCLLSSLFETKTAHCAVSRSVVWVSWEILNEIHTIFRFRSCILSPAATAPPSIMRANTDHQPAGTLPVSFSQRLPFFAQTLPFFAEPGFIVIKLPPKAP